MSGEFERIAAIRRLTGGRGRGVVLGIGDDSALLASRPGFDTAISSDLLVEGVHFRLATASPAQLGHKALAVSLSDMAAMGAEPCAAVVSLALPAGIDDAFIEEFYRGATAIADRFDTSVVGGDMSRSPSAIVIDSVLVGHVEEGRALRRDRARAGQDIYVSGVLGTSAYGLARLVAAERDGARIEPADASLVAHLVPEPRVGLGRALVERRLASAAIDVSDGLSSDLAHVCDASGVGAVLDASAVPAPVGLDLALHGGEQYELVFAADPADRADLAALAAETGVPLTRIGRFDGSVDGVWIEAEGTRTRLEPSGFDHFRTYPTQSVT